MVDTFKRWGQRALQLLHPFKFLYDALRLWLDADGLRMSAAMSFYGMLSLAPLLLLLVGLLGWWVDRATVESNLIDHVTSIMGARAAEVVQGALASARAPEQGRRDEPLIGFHLPENERPSRGTGPSDYPTSEIPRVDAGDVAEPDRSSPQPPREDGPDD